MWIYSPRGLLRTALLVCLAHSNGKLVGAGGTLEAAANAAQSFLNLINGQSDNQLGNALQVAVAAAGKADLTHDVAVENDTNLAGAGALSFVDVFHEFILLKSEINFRCAYHISDNQKCSTYTREQIGNSMDNPTRYY